MADPRHIKDLKPDPFNLRDHTPRNIGMIADALSEVGAARSIVIDEDGVILAGNGVVEAAALAGIEKVRVVDADGETLIAVRRSNLTPEQKTRLALYDNRAAELAKWNSERLAAVAEQMPAAVQRAFSEAELENLIGGRRPNAAMGSLQQAIQLAPGREYVVVVCDPENPAEFEQLKAALKLRLVRRGGYAEGSPFDDVGVERVIPASRLLSLLGQPAPGADDHAGRDTE